MSFEVPYFVTAAALLCTGLALLRQAKRVERSVSEWVSEMDRRDAEDDDTDEFYDLALESLEDEDECDEFLLMRNEILSLPETRS